MAHYQLRQDFVIFKSISFALCSASPLHIMHSVLNSNYVPLRPQGISVKQF